MGERLLQQHGLVFLVPCKMWLVHCRLLYTRTLEKSLFTRYPVYKGVIPCITPFPMYDSGSGGNSLKVKPLKVQTVWNSEIQCNAIRLEQFEIWHFLRCYNFRTNDFIFILKTPSRPYSCLAKVIFLLRTCLNVLFISTLYRKTRTTRCDENICRGML